MSAQEIFVALAMGIFIFSVGLVAGSETERKLAKDCQKISMFHPRLIHSEVRRG